MKQAFTKALAATAVSALLAACGASESGSDLETKEAASGGITGFGSVIVEGERYEDTGAVVLNSVDATDPAPASLDDLKLGMQVDLQADDGVAQTIEIHAEVIGRIDSLNADGFVVAGQTVVTTEDTVFDGASGASELANNDFVIVYGTRDDAGAINATRVELKPFDIAAYWRVAGFANNVDANAQTFELGSLTVAWTDQTRIAPSASAITDGARVVVFGNTAPVASVLTAKAIKVRGHGDEVDVRVRVAGRIRGLDFADQTFHIRRFSIDASEARYLNGTAEDLANGRFVRVGGTVAINDAGQRYVKASTVRYRGDFDNLSQITGPITHYVDPSSFTVRGVPVDASSDAVQFIDGSADNLDNGVIVQVKGPVDGNVLKAESVEFISTDLADRRSVPGRVRNYDATTGTFTVWQVGVQLSDTTIFEFANGDPASVNDLSNGDWVRVFGNANAGIFEAAKIVIRRDWTVNVDIAGTAYQVDINTGLFQVNGTIVRIGDTTQIDAVRENLHNGTRVQVSGTLENGELVSGQIDVIRD